MKLTSMFLALFCQIFLLQSAWASPPTSRPASLFSGLERVTVFVPYKKFETLSKRDGLFLTRTQFRALMKIVKEERARKSKRPPVRTLLTRAAYEGQANTKTVTLRASLQLRVFNSPQGTLVPLRFEGLPLQSAKLNGKPALLLHEQTSSGHYQLLVPKTGTYQLQLQFQGRVKSRPGWSQVHFRIPRTPYTQVRFRLAGTGIQATLQGDPHPYIEEKKEKTWLRSSIGPQSHITLRWSPKRKQTQQRKALISAKVIHQHQLQPNLLQSVVQVDYQILQAKLQKLILQLPPQQKLISVKGGPNLKPWQIRNVGKSRHLVLRFFRPFQGSYALRLELEKVRNPKETSFAIPQVKTLDTIWEQGFVALRQSGQFKLKPKTQQGLLQMDPREYVGRTKNVLPHLVFRYTRPNYQLSVGMEKIQPELKAKLFHQFHLTDKQTELHTHAKFTIKRAGVFRLRFKLPAGWELRDVIGDNIRDKYLEKSTSSTKKASPGPSTLVVVLKRQQGGPQTHLSMSPNEIFSAVRRALGNPFYETLSKRQKVQLYETLTKEKSTKPFLNLCDQNSKDKDENEPFSLTIQLRKKPNWKQPLSFDLVRALDVAAKDEKGVIGLMVADHFRIVTSKLKGLFEVEELKTLASEFFHEKLKLRQALRYNTRPLSGQLRLKKKKTSIESTIWLPFSLRPDGFQVKAKIRYKVRFAGTNKLTFSVPNAIVPLLQLQTEVREVRKVKGKTKTVYTCTLHEKVSQGETFTLVFHVRRRWKTPMQVGKPRALGLFSVTIPKAQKQEIYVGIRKEESLSLMTQQDKAWERVDLKDLPSWMGRDRLTHVFRSFSENPTSLATQIQKHKYQAVLSTVVSHMHLDWIPTLEGKLQALAFLTVRSQGRQFLKIQLPPRSQVLGLQVASQRRYRFELDRAGELLVDLANLANGRPFHIVLHYQTPLAKHNPFQSWSDSFSIKSPIISETPILRTTVQTYLPNQFTYTQFQTNMTQSSPIRGIWRLLRDELWGARTYIPWNGVYQLQKAGQTIARKVPKRGQQYRFLRLGGDASLTLSLRQSWFHSFLEFFVLLLSAIILFILGSRFRRSLVGFVSLFAILLLGTLLPEGWLQLCNASIFGWGLVTTYWSGVVFIVAIRQIRLFPKHSEESDEPSNPSPSGGNTPPPIQPKNPTSQGSSRAQGQGSTSAGESVVSESSTPSQEQESSSAQPLNNSLEPSKGGKS